jgi:hypothetical protein
LRRQALSNSEAIIVDDASAGSGYDTVTFTDTITEKFSEKLAAEHQYSKYLSYCDAYMTVSRRITQRLSGEVLCTP